MRHSRHPLQPRGGFWGTPSEKMPVQCQTTQYEKRLFTFCPCFMEPGQTVLIHGWGPGVRLRQGKRAPCFVILRNCLRFLLAVTRRKTSPWKVQKTFFFILLHVTLN